MVAVYAMAQEPVWASFRMVRAMEVGFINVARQCEASKHLRSPPVGVPAFTREPAGDHPQHRVGGQFISVFIDDGASGPDGFPIGQRANVIFGDDMKAEAPSAAAFANVQLFRRIAPATVLAVVREGLAEVVVGSHGQEASESGSMRLSPKSRGFTISQAARSCSAWHCW